MDTSLSPLETMLNDIAVIRTTFETLDVFPDHAELRREMGTIIADARLNLERRVSWMRDSAAAGEVPARVEASPLFRSRFREAVTRGLPRRTLDSLMRVTVFAEVAQRGCQLASSRYYYPLQPGRQLDETDALAPDFFVAWVLDDLLETIREEAHYLDGLSFDREVFQKHITLLYLCYASSNPLLDFDSTNG